MIWGELKTGENEIMFIIDRSFTLEEISNKYTFARQGYSKGKNLILINGN